MSAEMLRKAATLMRSRAEAALAVAEWLDECADDYGKDYGTPDTHALAVSAAYLGGLP